MFHRKFLISCVALVMAGLSFNAAARAASISYTATGNDSDGPLSGTVTFTPGNGALIVTLTNTLTFPIKQGQAVTDLLFGTSGIATPTSLTEISGVALDPLISSWTLGSGTAFDATGADVASHAWIYSGGVLTALSGGQPSNMILPSSGTWGPGKLATQFDPYLLGPTTFTLTDPSLTPDTILTTADFTNVAISFGTGPDTEIPGVPSAGGPPGGSGQPTPLPASVWSGVALIAGLALLRKPPAKKSA